MSKSILITGTSRGIGLEFVKQYANDEWKVFATYRNNIPETLNTLIKEGKNIVLVKLDVSDPKSIEELPSQLKDEPLDVLINNAGKMGNGGPPHLNFGELFGTLDYDAFVENMTINTYAPIKIAEVLTENIKKGSQKKVITICSGVASFAEPDTLPGQYWYKTSKTAMNRGLTVLAKDLKEHGITAVNFHPGLVITEKLEKMREKIISMSGDEKPFEMHEAVSNMRQVIENLTIEDTGKFMRNNGELMSW